MHSCLPPSVHQAHLLKDASAIQENSYLRPRSRNRASPTAAVGASHASAECQPLSADSTDRCNILIANNRREDVEDEVSNEDVLQRYPEGDDVGSVATWRIPIRYRSAVRPRPFLDTADSLRDRRRPPRRLRSRLALSSIEREEISRGVSGRPLHAYDSCLIGTSAIEHQSRDRPQRRSAGVPRERGGCLGVAASQAAEAL